MLRRLSLLFLLVVFLFSAGCVKETYDMGRISQKVKFSPTLALAAIEGDVSFSDMVKESDTIVFDQDNFVRIIFEEDSIIDLKLADFYDLTDMVSFAHNYVIGELDIDPFYETMNLSLDAISENFSTPLRAQFLALDNTTNNFPAFPVVDLGQINFPEITTFEHATFASGVIEISIKNNLPAPLYGMTIRLYNGNDNSNIGSEATVSSIAPGSLVLTSIDLADETIVKNIVAEVVLNGSPGTSTPVYIDLAGSGVEIGIRGKDLKVKSGRVVLPLQTLTSLDNKDTIDFDPGSDIELDEFKITSGTVTYVIESTSPVGASLDITLPNVLRAGVSLTESLSVSPNGTINGSINVDNTVFDLGTDQNQPYNRVPMDYMIEVSSGGLMVDYDMSQYITLDFSLADPDFDYLKGYFGQQTEVIEPYNMNLEIEDILRNISGDFQVSDPSITLNYSNSFAVPIEIELNATATRGSENVDLNLDPFVIELPEAPASRDISSSFTIDRSNSSLSELISLPPEEVNFTGSAKTNTGGNTGLRDNYIFGNSRFIGSLEVEVPMELRINDLQFADTLKNFLAPDSEDENSFSPGDFEFLRIDITAKNGFPLGVSLRMSLFDSLTQTIKSTIDASGILEPAPVDANGRATGTTDTSTSLEFTTAFFDAIDSADKIIFSFTLNTSENGSKDVKIYSDYRIEFNASLVLKPDFNFK